ncbi:VWA domain-containing protein [Candidatus Woesearchaeota archaeon]|jgi:uncharacterized membrane protein|nr:VWA domain-containing protein [Candidatus Woesearchaeota archaeon]
MNYSTLWNDFLTELSSVNWLDLNFQKQNMLFFLIPLIIVLIIFIKFNWIKLDPRLKENKKYRIQRGLYRFFVFCSRLIVFSLLILALAEPFGEVTREIPGNTEVHILIDNSSSMELFDTSFVTDLKNKIEEQLPVNSKIIAKGVNSNIGDNILTNLESDRNILLISDGQVSSGLSLGSVSLMATNLNSTISAIKLEESESDISIKLIGPKKTIADVDNTYKILLNRVGENINKKTKIAVYVDDEEILTESTTENEITFKRNFTEGTHTIHAKLKGISLNHFKQNDNYYKTTSVIKRPKVLLITKEATPLETILGDLYDLTVMQNIPSKEVLDEFYATVLNDLPIETINPEFSALQQYVIEGNGLLVIGGYDSYDNGGYKDSLFETLLPINIGTATKLPGGANVVLVIDISGSTGYGIEGSDGKAVDIEKALAISVINDIHENNRVGAVAFNDQAYKVSDIEPLFVHKAELKTKIASLKDGGPTVLQSGLRGAFELLHGKSGSRNVVWITDGQTMDTIDLLTTQDIIESMNAQGIRVFIIGVGANTNEEYLSKMGKLAGGFYLKATESNKLKILFGEPEKEDVGEAFGLFILDPSHFITDDLILNAVMYGYNQVVPKTAANLLVTTDGGEPALTVWRYGIGRVGALTVFSGGNNLGELLNAKNSRLLTRNMNWLIGEPERKEPYFVEIVDSRVNKKSTVIVKSEKFPKAEGLTFNKIDENKYKAEFVRTKTGFDTLLSKDFGVNYDPEFENIGVSPNLNTVVHATGGKVFKPDQVDKIIKHVKSVSKRSITERTLLTLPFLVLALLLFLLEVVLRRIYETWILR